MSLSKEAKSKSRRELVYEMRAICPNAYALSATEALRVARVDNLIWNFFDQHRDFVKIVEAGSADRAGVYCNVYNDKSVSLLRDTFKSKRLNLNNAAQIAYRVLGGLWFSLIGVVDMNENAPKQTALITDKGTKVLNRAEWAEFYKVWDEQGATNAEALRRALDLEAGCLYIELQEINTLKLIVKIAEYQSEPFEREQIQPGYIIYKSTKETTALNSVGYSAIKGARYDEMNERYDLTSSTGVKVYLRGRLMNKGNFANIDKLLRQLMNRAVNDGFVHREIELSLDEYMSARGLRDRKEARQQYSRDAIDLSNVIIEVSEMHKKKEGLARLPILGKQWEPSDTKAPIRNSSILFALNADFFELLKRSQSIGYLPEGLLTMDGRSDNAYTLGAYIWDDARRNLHNGKRERRLKINTLLTVCGLKTALEVEPKYHKRQIIKPFFEALAKASKPEYGNFSYEIVSPDGKTLTAQEAAVSYDLFASCLIAYELNAEPDYFSQYRESKSKRQRKS